MIVEETKAQADQGWYSWLRTLVCVVLATVLAACAGVWLLRRQRGGRRGEAEA